MASDEPGAVQPPQPAVIEVDDAIAIAEQVDD
jgi:hypothetical protein